MTVTRKNYFQSKMGRFVSDSVPRKDLGRAQSCTTRKVFQTVAYQTTFSENGYPEDRPKASAFIEFALVTTQTMFT